MTDKLKILGLSGSLRAGSFNTALLREATAMAGEHGLEIVTQPIGDLPFYDGDIEAKGDPPEVLRLKQAVTGASGLLIASPEYNHSVTAVLKNAIDWAARNREKGIAFAPLAGKPVAIMGAGGRAGTARGQLHLRQILAETRSLVMVQPTLLVDRAREKFTDGKLTDQETIKGLHVLLDGLREWVKRFS